jgi:hypothetical protein
LPSSLLALALSFLAGEAFDGSDRFWVAFLVASGLAQRRDRTAEANMAALSAPNSSLSSSEEYTSTALFGSPPALLRCHGEGSDSAAAARSSSSDASVVAEEGVEAEAHILEKSEGLAWPLLGGAWLRFMTGERASREAALAMGDFSVDLECNVWPAVSEAFAKKQLAPALRSNNALLSLLVSPRSSTCDAQRAPPRATAWAPVPRIS